MASGFFAILDDIASLMDDIAVTTKVAAQKTAGILGDDLAVNAEKATGFVSSRELPVLWAITKGSLLNKLIIIPIALLLNVFFPVAIKVALVLGGIYLSYEGVEKIVEFLFHRGKQTPAPVTAAAPENPPTEKARIKAAITTDFILSIEIVIIALGAVLNQALLIQVVTVTVVSAMATVGVYGIVAIIVRMDDVGYKMISRTKNKGFWAVFGNGLVKALPVIIRILSVVGTIALVVVAGGIFEHNIPYFHHLLPGVASMIKQVIYGLLVGLLMVGLMTAGKKLIALFKGR
ncbi:hypothetical protein GA0116948_10127 [Chitinophaga costaii]|uniref:Inner membrane protein YedI n=1 Tax=Chitinophaga costaii TaxID=1335309 RepID=A0A1C3YPL3_9BACT|nr:DUF808 family protein [Chitinophaga costaii]PUZ30040.1 DUF808 domain-containing protein [Chitinophaga costaii]SCB71992.1 hypothetical protein GA0116948_10127 [Chitinophaga costaii]